MIEININQNKKFIGRNTGPSLVYFTADFYYENLQNNEIEQAIRYYKSLGLFAVFCTFDMGLGEKILEYNLIKLNFVLLQTSEYKINVFLKLKNTRNSNLKILKRIIETSTKNSIQNTGTVIALIIDNDCNFNYFESLGLKGFCFKQDDFYSSNFIKNISAKLPFDEFKKEVFSSLSDEINHIYITDLNAFNLNYNSDFNNQLKYLIRAIIAFSNENINEEYEASLNNILCFYTKNRTYELLYLYTDESQKIKINFKTTLSKAINFVFNLRSSAIIPINISFFKKNINYALLEIFQRVSFTNEEIWFAKSLDSNDPIISIDDKTYPIEYAKKNVFNFGQTKLTIYCIPSNIQMNYNILLFRNNPYLLLSKNLIFCFKNGIIFNCLEEDNIYVLPRPNFILSENLLLDYNDDSFSVYKMNIKAEKVHANFIEDESFILSIPQFVYEFDFNIDFMGEAQHLLPCDIVLCIFALEQCKIKTILKEVNLKKGEIYYLSIKEILSYDKKCKIEIFSTKKPTAFFKYVYKTFILSNTSEPYIIY
ncbi:MAG: hypothetical protein SPI49_04940 [Eubacteriales bacterium]|nr:hypothetical protein [Eubacteriales bacterium]